MTKRSDPWFKRYPDDFFKGTRTLSLEARGAYNDILDLIYMHGGPIPDDDFQIACALRIKQPKWRAVRKELFAKGKLILRPEGITNERAEQELFERKTTQKNYASRYSSRNNPEVAKPRNRNDINTSEPQNGTKDGLYARASSETRVQSPESKLESNSSVESVARPAPAAVPPKVDLIDLRNRLVEAANGSLASEAVCPGLAVMTIPEMWIREGADLERDILPTVRSVGARQHGEKIRDWKYFNQAVSNAKARRERGLPPPDLVGAQHGGPHRPSAKVAAAQLLRDQMFNRRSA